MKISELNKKDLGGEGLPKGDTIIDFSTLDVEPTQLEYDGVTKTRYLLKISENESYFVPKGVMSDLKQTELDGFPKARVTRTGEKLETKYTVVGLK